MFYPHVYATEIQDIVFDPPDEGPFEKLKEQLTARRADSERQNLLLPTTVLLLAAKQPEDRKPTYLLRKMQLLLGEKGEDHL